MATPERPHFERKPHHFDPAILARSVIALPLLEQINQELAVTTNIEKEHPRIRDTHNSQSSCAGFSRRPDSRIGSRSQAHSRSRQESRREDAAKR